MRGRKPTPSNIVQLKGNPGKRAINRDEPKPESKIPDCPTDVLGEEGQKEWARITPELHRLGLLTNIDRAALTAYCLAWQRMCDAEREIKKDGMIVKAKNGYPMVSPYLPIMNKAFEQMAKMLGEFGLSPSSRSRIKADKPTGNGEDPAAQYFD